MYSAKHFYHDFERIVSEAKKSMVKLGYYPLKVNFAEQDVWISQNVPDVSAATLKIIRKWLQ